MKRELLSTSGKEISTIEADHVSFVPFNQSFDEGASYSLFFNGVAVV